MVNRLLYIAAVPIDFDNLDGVPKKILCQAKTLQESFEVDILSYINGNVFMYNVGNEERKILKSASSKLDVLKAARNVVNMGQYDCSYVRYPRSDYFFLQMLRTFKKKHITTVVEIPTYPYDMEGKETIKGRIINMLDRFYRIKIQKYVDRIVTYSKDKTIFNIPTINTINGIDFERLSYDIRPLNLSKEINMIAVSAMFKVHGYERLIEGLHDYYENGGERNVVLKLIGKGDECSKYERLVEQYKLEQHVYFYGAQFGMELQKLYEGNAIGINSLAIHRQGLIEESTLKTKEYAAKGLPVLSSSYVDAFSKDGNDHYVMRIPADESNVDINKLINFVDGLYVNNQAEHLREQIREDGQKTCDIRITMKPVMQYLLNKDIM